MKVSLIGAGAVGAYFIWGLMDNPDVDFVVIAEGDRKEKLERNGIKINDKIYRPTIKTPDEVSDQDLILIATKYSGLENAIDYLLKMMKNDTIVLSLLNGVDSEEKIAEKIGWNNVEYSLMRIASKRDENGIYFNPDNTMGLYTGVSKMTESMKKILLDSKINCTFEKNIVQDVWIKYASNIANNLPQAVLGTTAALYFDSKHGLFLAERLWNEVYQVAKAKGIDVGIKPMIFDTVPKTSKYSTLQDLESKRHTEIDMFAGTLMEMAKEYEIEVPFTEYTYHAIKALEEKNDGVFN